MSLCPPCPHARPPEPPDPRQQRVHRECGVRRETSTRQTMLGSADRRRAGPRQGYGRLARGGPEGGPSLCSTPGLIDSPVGVNVDLGMGWKGGDSQATFKYIFRSPTTSGHISSSSPTFGTHETQRDCRGLDSKRHHHKTKRDQSPNTDTPNTPIHGRPCFPLVPPTTAAAIPLSDFIPSHTYNHTPQTLPLTHT